MRRWITFPAVLLLAAPLAIRAASPEHDACLARAGNNVVQRGACDQTEFAREDTRLNKAYQKVMEELAGDPAGKTTLRNQERAWLRQRDSTCKLSGATIDMACMIARTTERADELQGRIR